MTRDEAVAEVQRGLGFRSDLTTEIQLLFRFMQDQREKSTSRTIPWFLQVFDIPFTITAPTINYDLPTGWLRELDEKDGGGLRYKPTTGTRSWFLRKMDFRAAEKFFYGDWQSTWDTQQSVSDAISPGLPRAYVLQGTQVRIYPVPDVNYSLLWNFYRQDDVLTTGAQENKWLRYAPWVLIGLVGQKIAADSSNAQAMPIFNSMLQSAEANLFTTTIEREEAGRTRAMGSSL